MGFRGFTGFLTATPLRFQTNTVKIASWPLNIFGIYNRDKMETKICDSYCACAKQDIKIPKTLFHSVYFEPLWGIVPPLDVTFSFAYEYIYHQYTIYIHDKWRQQEGRCLPLSLKNTTKTPIFLNKGCKCACAK